MSLPYQWHDKNQNKVPTSSLNTDKIIDSDLEALAKLRRDYPSYPMIGYLNLNSIRNKIVQLTDLCIDETKLDSSFPNEQVHLPPFRRDRNSSGGGKIGIIARRDNYEKVNCL